MNRWRFQLPATLIKSTIVMKNKKWLLPQNRNAGFSSRVLDALMPGKQKQKPPELGGFVFSYELVYLGLVPGLVLPVEPLLVSVELFL